MEAEDLLAFYASHGRMTDPGEASALLDPLPSDVAALSRIIQGLGIYDVVAQDFYGFKPAGDRLSDIHLRPIAKRLARIVELDDRSLDIAREPERRVLQRCNSFALLLVTMLRAKGVPARSRCGFAAYFNPPNFEDHWVCEYWDAQEGGWRLADAQIDEVWRRRLGIRFDTLDLPRAEFLTASDAWRRCRSGEADERFGISFAGLRGLWFVAGSLVRDVAALNKMEMAPWDVWGAQPWPREALDLAFLTIWLHYRATRTARFCRCGDVLKRMSGCMCRQPSSTRSMIGAKRSTFQERHGDLRQIIWRRGAP
jgi:hypothetical protein